MKPILATDAVINDLQYPFFAMPKIDGVRALNVNGKLVGRSGKPFKNRLNTKFFSREIFSGFDGEMVVNSVTGERLCNTTTSALNTIQGQINTRWCLFDRIPPDNKIPYHQRYSSLTCCYRELTEGYPELLHRIWVIPTTMIYNQEELLQYEEEVLKEGFEGVIIRDPDAPYKFGRSTVKEGYFLRIKRFYDTEGLIVGIKEGFTNLNAPKRDPNGKINRSTFKGNMAPNGMLGTIIVKPLVDVIYRGQRVIQADKEIEISPGKMTHLERKYFFENQSELMGKIAKFQYFPIGIKDKPRFPTFQSFRDNTDL